MCSAERTQQRDDLEAAERDRQVDAQLSGRLQARLAQHLPGFIKVRKNLPATLQERGPVFGQVDASRGAGQQLHAQLTLKSIDGVADPGLAHAKFCGGTHEAAPLADLDEYR